MHQYQKCLFIVLFISTGLLRCTPVTPTPSPLPTPTFNRTASPIPPTPTATPSPLPTSTLTATLVPSATSIAPATPSIRITLVAREDPLPPPPTPNAPLSEALQPFTHNALLVSRYEQFLVLWDIERNTDLWVTEDACNRTPSPSTAEHGYWSFDGAFLGVHCEDELSTESPVVRVLNTQSGEWTYIANPAPHNTEYTLYGWSPTANHLAIGERSYNDEGDTSNLILFDATENISVTIPADDVIINVLWSPDGSQLALVSYDYTNTDAPQTLYILASSGIVVKRIALFTDAGSMTFTGWDPNGHVLHFYTTERGSGTLDIETEQSEIGSGISPGGTYYIWSPTKEWYIAGTGYAQDQSMPSIENLSWSLYEADGTLVRDLSTNSTRQDFTFDWFPDGQRFVMVSMQAGIWVITENNVDSTITRREIARVNTPEGYVSAPTVKISPDGSLIAFSTSGSSITVVFDLQGNEILQQSGLVQGWRPE